MTDNQFLLHVLSDGDWHSNSEILGRSLAERGCGLTIHSRAADLRKAGHIVEVDVHGGDRRVSFYRLVGVLDAAPCVASAGDDGQPSFLPSVGAASSTPASNQAVSSQGIGVSDNRLDGTGVLTLFDTEVAA